MDLSFFQSNAEHELINRLHEAKGSCPKPLRHPGRTHLTPHLHPGPGGTPAAPRARVVAAGRQRSRTEPPARLHARRRQRVRARRDCSTLEARRNRCCWVSKMRHNFTGSCAKIMQMFVKFAGISPQFQQFQLDCIDFQKGYLLFM